MKKNLIGAMFGVETQREVEKVKITAHEKSYLAACVKIDKLTKQLEIERAISAKMAQTLKDVKDAICQNAMDTLWMPSCYSPNCTTVDWIDMALAEHEKGTP